MTCIACGAPMEETSGRREHRWVCRACGCRAVDLLVLEAMRPSVANKFWGVIEEAAGRVGPNCPSCGEAMKVLMFGSANLEQEFCVRCNLLWTRPGEFEKLLDHLRALNEGLRE